MPPKYKKKVVETSDSEGWQIGGGPSGQATKELIDYEDLNKQKKQGKWQKKKDKRKLSFETKEDEPPQRSTTPDANNTFFQSTKQLDKSVPSNNGSQNTPNSKSSVSKDDFELTPDKLPLFGGESTTDIDNQI